MEQVKIKLAPQPFAQGKFRYAFKTLIWAGTDWQPAVAKMYRESHPDLNTRTQYLKQIEVSTISQFLAQEYNMVRDTSHLPVYFADCHVAELTQSDGTQVSKARCRNPVTRVPALTACTV